MSVSSETLTKTTQIEKVETMKFSGKILDFNLDLTSNGNNHREYFVGAMRYGNWRQFVAAELFDAKTGKGEQRGIIEAHAKKIKADMSRNKYAPTTFTVGTRESHRVAIEVENNIASLNVSKKDKLPLLDGNNRTYALELLRTESRGMMKLVDEVYIPYILYLDGNPQEDFIVLQAGRPVSRDHMLSVRIATGLVDQKHAPYFSIAKDVAEILHVAPDSFCHNLIQFDSNGTKLPISLNSVCTKSGSDLAFSLYGGAKLAVNYKKDSKWLSECILTAWRAIKQDDEGSELLHKGNILAPIPDGTKAGTSLIVALGNMLAARLMLKEVDEPTDEDLQTLVECAVEHLNLKVRGNTSADAKRQLFKKFVVDFFSDIVADPDDKTDNDGDVPTKKVGAHEGVPVALIRLLSPSTFNVSKLPSTGKRGRKPKIKLPDSASLVKDNDVSFPADAARMENDVNVDVDDDRADSEDPIDAEAFADEDLNTTTREFEQEQDEDDSAPWDDVETL